MTENAQNLPTDPPKESKGSEEESPREHKVTIWLVIAVITTVLGSGFPSGYSLGVINTPQEIIRAWTKTTIEDNIGHVTTTSEDIYIWAVIVSIYIVGATIGSPFGGILADKGGRRLGLFVNHLLFLIAAVLCMGCKSANSMYMLIFGRFFSGICSGLSCSLMPVYLSEVVPSAYRGVMGVILPSSMCLGVLVAQLLGMESILGTQDCWPYLLGGFGIPVLMALILHPALPNSPAYCYVVLEDETKGKQALYHLRGGPSKIVELEESSLRSQMVKNKYTSDTNSWGLLSLIKNEKYQRPLLIAMVFNMGQQFSGINAVFYYSTLIFRSAGLSTNESQGASIGAAGMNWIVSLIAIPLIRYTRRRILMLWSAALSIVCLSMVMISLALIPTLSVASYIAIAALLFYVVAYNIGLGPIPFMIATELFPSGPRSVGISVGSTSNWFSNLIVGLTFPLIQNQIGEYSFVFFIISTCLLWIFTYMLLPETLGIEEVDSSQSSKPVALPIADIPNEI